MKNLKKIILFSILTLMILPLFLKSRTAAAQEWTYEGVNTERIPEFSVYPSEWYVINSSINGIPLNHTIYEVVKANISNTFQGSSSLPFFGSLTNGTGIYFNLAEWNTTTDTKHWYVKNSQGIYWNGTTFIGQAAIFPINESTGEITGDIMNNILNSVQKVLLLFVGLTFEHSVTYPDINSFKLWNSSYNNAYLSVNSTKDGIMKEFRSFNVPDQYNMSLYSMPAQQSPDFSFTTDSGSFTVNSTKFKLNITISNVDNNNDGEIDTDYLYRIQNGTDWTEWAAIPNLLDWDLGDVEEGSYDITAEVKNMYGITQEVITIEYSPPDEGDGDEKGNGGIIPGYPLFLMLIFFTGITSILIKKHRKKI